MGRKKVNYTTEEIRNNFKYIYLKDDEMYAMTTEMPFKDNDYVYVFTKTEKYSNQLNKWFRASELTEV